MFSDLYKLKYIPLSTEIGHVCIAYFMYISWFLGLFIQGKYSLQIAFQALPRADPILHQNDGQGETSATKDRLICSVCCGDPGGVKGRLTGFLFFCKREKNVLKLLFHLALIPGNSQEKRCPFVHFFSQKFGWCTKWVDVDYPAYYSYVFLFLLKWPKCFLSNTTEMNWLSNFNPLLQMAAVKNLISKVLMSSELHKLITYWYFLCFRVEIGIYNAIYCVFTAYQNRNSLKA